MNSMARVKAIFAFFSLFWGKSQGQLGFGKENLIKENLISVEAAHTQAVSAMFLDVVRISDSIAHSSWHFGGNVLPP